VAGVGLETGINKVINIGVDTGVDMGVDRCSGVITGADGAVRPYRIRSATLADSAALATLLSQSFPLVPIGWDWLLPLVRLGIYEDLRQRLREPAAPFFPGTAARTHYACWVAVAAGASVGNHPDREEIVGTAEISWKPNGLWPRRWSATAPQATAIEPESCVPPYLANLAVGQNMRRQGVAEALLAACERSVQIWGWRQVDLHVMANNLPARQLYLKAGYQIEHRESDWRTWMFQRPQRFLLRKSLKAKP
jgi:GNAT superfamily N-acetyltransferase